MFQDLIGRVRRLLTAPKAEWSVIDGERLDRQKLVMSYVAVLAAIPAAATIIGQGILGPFTIGAAISMAIVSYVLAIVWVFVFAFIINALAPSFGAASNADQAFKIAAYAPTAAWVAGVFQLVPALGILSLLGSFYSLYLLFVGLPMLMKPSPEKATVYTLATIGAAIVAALIIGFVTAAVGLRP